MNKPSKILDDARVSFECGDMSSALSSFLQLAEEGERESLSYIGRIALVRQLDADSLCRAKTLLHDRGCAPEHLFFLGVVQERCGASYEAADAYRRAANRGSAAACYQLALLLRRLPSLSSGGKDNMENWLLTAANGGHIYARGLVAKLNLEKGLLGSKFLGIWQMLNTMVSAGLIVLRGSNKQDPFSDPRLWRISDKGAA